MHLIINRLHFLRSAVRQLAQVILISGICLSITFAAPPPLPADDQAMHHGVASCSASTCHGALTTWKEQNILNNEYVIWSRKDSHAQAYNVLLNEDSRRIAKKLGLRAAHTARICLDCHADNVPEYLRGEKFQLSDGVGCEACHGGSERWLASHTSGKASHGDNIESGLYATDNPSARARLCMACHYGNKDKMVTHRIMGAGHPRLSFELDTFTTIQPAHYQVDDDYQRRKQTWDAVQVWSIGQAMAMDTFLDNYIESLNKTSGLFPELVFFDCHACHHSMKQQRWTPHHDDDLGPGVVRLNDANFVMLHHLLAQLDEKLAIRFRKLSRQLHVAAENDRQASKDTARQLRALLNTLLPRLSGLKLGEQQMRNLLTDIIREGIQKGYRDYMVAEQATMAIATISTALHESGALDHNAWQSFKQHLDTLYKTVQDDDHYKPQAFAQALRKVQTALAL